MRPTPTHILIALAALALSACASATGGPLQSRVGPPLGEAWKVDLPEGFDGWEVHAAGPCALVFGWSTELESDTSSRMLQCRDRTDGTLRWERRVPVQGGFIQDRLFTAEGVLIYVNHHAAMGVRLDDGELAWTFDPNDRAISEVVHHGDTLYLSLERRILCALDVATGEWSRGIAVNDRRLLDVASTETGEVALLLEETRTGRRVTGRTLQAVELDVEGGDTPEPPYASMVTRWSLKVEGEHLNLQVVDATIVGFLDEGTFFGVNPDDGEVLFEEPVDLGRPSSRGRNKKWYIRRKHRRARNNLASLDADLTPRRLPAGARFMLGRGHALIAQATRSGLVMDMLHLERRDPRDLGRAWTLDLGWKEIVQVKQELPAARLAMLANRRRVAFVDIDTGVLLMDKPLATDKRGWRSIATDGVGLYLVLDEGATPTLEGHPL